MAQDWTSKLLVFPLLVGKKSPAHKGWQEAAKRNDSAEAEEWRRLGRDLGIKCGVESNVTVLDEDGPKGIAELERLAGKVLPPHPIVHTSKDPFTGFQKRQHYFQHPRLKTGVKNAVKFLGDLDLRTEGGLVVAAGARSIPGHDYEPQNDLEPPELPIEFIHVIERLQMEKKPAPNAALPEKIKDGGRNDTLFKSGCSLRGKCHTENEITALLLVANRERCEPPLPESEVRLIAASCAKLTPGAAKVEAKPKRKLFLNLGSMATVENKQLKWLKRHIILAAALNLFVGDPDVGKTLVAIFYIAELSRAGKKIIINCREDDYSSMFKPRLVAAGANLENVLPVFGVGVEGSDEEIPWSFDDQRHLELLEQAITEHEAALCYIDPLADFAGALNLNVSGDVRKITGALAGIAKRTGAAVLVACHTTKAVVDSGIKTASGSFQLMAAVQSSWLLMTDSDVKDQRLMLQGRNKSGKKRGFKYTVESRPWPSAECGAEDLEVGETSDGVGLVVFKGVTDKDASDILQQKLEKGASEIARVRQWITDFLAKGPVATATCWKAAREAMGFSNDSVNKACLQLHIVRNSKTWTLPQAQAPEKKEETQLDLAGGV